MYEKVTEKAFKMARKLCGTNCKDCKASILLGLELRVKKYHESLKRGLDSSEDSCIYYDCSEFSPESIPLKYRRLSPGNYPELSLLKDYVPLEPVKKPGTQEFLICKLVAVPTQSRKRKVPDYNREESRGWLNSLIKRLRKNADKPPPKKKPMDPETERLLEEQYYRYFPILDMSTLNELMKLDKRFTTTTTHRNGFMEVRPHLTFLTPDPEFERTRKTMKPRVGEDLINIPDDDPHHKRELVFSLEYDENVFCDSYENDKPKLPEKLSDKPILPEDLSDKVKLPEVLSDKPKSPDEVLVDNTKSQADVSEKPKLPEDLSVKRSKDVVAGSDTGFMSLFDEKRLFQKTEDPKPLDVGGTELETKPKFNLFDTTSTIKGLFSSESKPDGPFDILNKINAPIPQGNPLFAPTQTDVSVFTPKTDGSNFVFGQSPTVANPAVGPTTNIFANIQAPQVPQNQITSPQFVIPGFGQTGVQQPAGFNPFAGQFFRSRRGRGRGRGR